MPSVINACSGQSVYDLCLMALGSLDQLVTFCDDNGVTDLNAAPYTGQPFYFNSTNEQNASLLAATLYIPEVDYTPIEQTGLPYNLPFNLI